MRTFAWFLAIAWLATPPARGEAPLVRSAGSGRWSLPSTWEGGRPPAPGGRVQVRAGHSVVFDARVESAIRSIHVAGTLEFDPECSTLLTVGLLKVQAGDDLSEAGFEAHGSMPEGVMDRPALLVGTPRRPIAAGHSAVIRLAEVAGLDPETCPAIVCRGGRMEFHGAPATPTWAKLGGPANAGDSSVLLDREPEGWRAGDRVIVTATRHQFERDEALTPRVREAPQTEERVIRAVDGPRLALDAPLAHAHTASGHFRGEVALLSRNLVVESADPGGVRGHTMYHRGSAGSISYAEFRHLGKPGKLGKYSLHFHKAGDSMRGSSVVGASIWDSGNRWITIHGTNRLVVRDCVGYRALGHGFFLEDGTEVDNIFDGNLAVQAIATPPLPGQVLAFDRNEGAGFWWANSRNSFARNVAAECDGYGFRFEAPTSADFDPVLPLRGADGRTAPGDVRVQPFVRFDDNEAHAMRRYGVNLGGPPEGDAAAEVVAVGPDSSHPFAIRGLKVWDSHWAFTPATPGLLADGVELAHSEYGLYRANFDRQSYRGLSMYQCGKRHAETRGRPPDPSAYPNPLAPVDDRPPVGVITGVEPLGRGRYRVEGCSTDDGPIRSVRVNAQEARPLAPDFSRWEATVGPIEGPAIALTATTEDAAGNVERTPHVVTISPPPGGPGQSTPGRGAAH